ARLNLEECRLTVEVPDHRGIAVPGDEDRLRDEARRILQHHEGLPLLFDPPSRERTELGPFGCRHPRPSCLGAHVAETIPSASSQTEPSQPCYPGAGGRQARRRGPLGWLAISGNGQAGGAISRIGSGRMFPILCSLLGSRVRRTTTCWV